VSIGDLGKTALSGGFRKRCILGGNARRCGIHLSDCSAWGDKRDGGAKDREHLLHVATVPIQTRILNSLCRSTMGRRRVTVLNSAKLVTTRSMLAIGSLSRPARGFRLPGVAGAGAAFAIGIGYIDPGNWATDLNATQFGDTLLWSVVASGVAAALLQILVIRFCAASGQGLMEAIAHRFVRTTRYLWPPYCLAIIATELGEFVGLAIGVQLVLGCSFMVALGLAIFAFALLLLAGGTLARGFERVAVATTATVAAAYVFEILTLHPKAAPIVEGLVSPHVRDSGAAAAVVGIIGATIMPHNLFLHGGLLKDALADASSARRGRVVRSAILTTVATLLIATVINAAILVVGSCTHSLTIEQAFRTLRPMAGSSAALVFGSALIGVSLAAAAGGACAGDIIFSSGPVSFTRLQRRALAIAPAAALLAFGIPASAVLVGSQIILAMALPAVVIPLVIIALKDRSMKTFADRTLLSASAVVLVATCACNGMLISLLFANK
jgi:manganese transport protein